MKKSILIIFVSICLGVSFNVSAKKKSDNHLVLNLIGTGYMYTDTVPDTDGDGVDEDAICFDVNLVDMKKNKVIGTATDCLSNIGPAITIDTGTEADPSSETVGLALVGTTYFDMGKKGTLITRGKTTVQPIATENHPIVTPTGQTITHITGASGIGNSILEEGRSRKFKNATGTVRLSGMVDLTNFFGGIGDPITFDCIYIIDLD